MLAMQQCNTAQEGRRTDKGEPKGRKAGTGKNEKERSGGGGSQRMSGKEREGQGVYPMLVTAAVFHFDTSPLNDDPEKMPLRQGRQACTGDAAVQHHGTAQDGRGTNKGKTKSTKAG